MIVFGEDTDGEANDEDKPIRVLNHFSIFDPKHQYEMVSLSTIEEDDGVDRECEGAGLVTPFVLNDEDEGQEDGLDSLPQYVRLGAILRFSIDYTKEEEYALVFIAESTIVLILLIFFEVPCGSRQCTRGMYSKSPLSIICGVSDNFTCPTALLNSSSLPL